MSQGATFGAPTQRTSYDPLAQRRSQFPGPQFWSMSLPSSQDQADDDDNDNILYFKCPGIIDVAPSDDNHVEPPTSSLLQLHTLCTTADFDLNLSLIA